MDIRITTSSQPTIDKAGLESYRGSPWQPIFLHFWNAKRKDKKTGKLRDIGKAPLDPKWTIKAYVSDEVIKQCVRVGRNMGIRLKAEQLVIDVDPRNGGDVGFANLCEDFKLDPSAWPHVITGSGGDHYYLTLPPGIRILGSLAHESDDPERPKRARYRGVEFKSKGQQVVSAGSRHPNGKLYEWCFDSPLLSEAPMCHANLVKAITRPKPTGEVTKGGHYTQEQIAVALYSLDVRDYQDHDKWFRLMCACHHASNGDARAEFIEWSTSDPSYAHESDAIGRRWDSLHTQRSDGQITVATLNKALADAGAADAQAAPDASDDFEGEPIEESSPDASSADWLEGGPCDEDDGVKNENAGGLNNQSRSKLDALNDKYCAMFAAGKYRIMFREPSRDHMRWTSTSKQDFISRYENQSIQSGNKTISLGKAWQEAPRRKTADGITFDTKGKPGELINGKLNVWGGFGIEPKMGCCDKFKAMILTDLCSGDQRVFDYIIKWIAWKIQHPAGLPEVCIVLRGPRGVGKTTLGETLVTIMGEHGMAIRSFDEITGKHNGHAETLCEAPGDRQGVEGASPLR
jgi:hypothetical protein